eukprot:scaffold10953_cov108-Skeletonema_dohrnii-CCMP3373.AAC.9
MACTKKYIKHENWPLDLAALTLTASKVEPIAIKLEINRAQYHILRGDFKDATNARGRVDVVVALAIDVE